MLMSLRTNWNIVVNENKLRVVLQKGNINAESFVLGFFLCVLHDEKVMLCDAINIVFTISAISAYFRDFFGKRDSSNIMERPFNEHGNSCSSQHFLAITASLGNALILNAVYEVTSIFFQNGNGVRSDFDILEINTSFVKPRQTRIHVR